MDKRFLAIIGVIVVVFGGILLFGGKHDGNGSGGSSNAKPTNHVEGNTNSKVTFVEYGDFECPICEEYYPTVKQVEQKYASTVKFQFRNLPLSSIHPNAFAGARAAEAAADQGQFWGMHDLLYENQDPNGASGWVASSDPLDDYFVGFAKQLKLNVAQFKTDFASSAVNNRINADINAFSKTGQQEATPTFFLNGKYVSNEQLVDNNGPSLAAFSKVIDAALKSAGQQN
jgi:protein-disulfide isomerase